MPKGTRPATVEKWALLDEAALDYINNHIKKIGWAPSQREIASHLGISVHGSNLVVARLEEAGKIKTGPYPRQIKVL